MAPAADETLLSPKELDNGKGSFAFAHEDMVSLMRYIWEGSLLPHTRHSYGTAFGLELSQLNKDISAELDSILDSYGKFRSETMRAITAVGKIEGAWTIIGGDLQGIHDLVENDSKHPLNEVITKLDANKIVEKWNAVHDYTTKYISTAFISEVETKDIKQYLKELEEAAKNNTPSSV
ncbi:hypothetical protein BDV18DRAFT_163816 [Aspergillus unguis]